jgi:predicted house-cleaning noncanonical NTP pyrophosphatase (MazG superfamily)
LADSGIKATFRVLDHFEYMDYLEKKLDEEVAEFHESKDIEELADIMEVLQAILVERGCNLEDFETMQIKKRWKRGGFGNRILLLDIEEGATDEQN